MLLNAGLEVIQSSESFECRLTPPGKSTRLKVNST